MISKFSVRFDAIADQLEAEGFLKEALAVDKLADLLEKCSWCGGRHGKWEGPLPKTGDFVKPAEKGRLLAPFKDGTFKVHSIIPASNRFWPTGQKLIGVRAEGSSGEEIFPLDCVRPIK